MPSVGRAYAAPMHRIVAPLLALTLLLPAGAQAAERTGRLVVILARTGAAHAAAAPSLLAARAGTRIDGPNVPQIGMLTVRPKAGVDLAGAVRDLRAQPGVVSVEIEHSYALRADPDDPALKLMETAPGTPAGTRIEWWAAREGFPDAWKVTDGEQAVVGVIDTGIDINQPDVGPKVVVALDRDDSPGGGPPTTDESGHGTLVSSLACAATGNAIGLAGAGDGCRLVVIKSDLTDSSVAAAIVDATDRGVLALNMSFGSDGIREVPDEITRAIQYATSHQVVLVAAAADAPVEEQGDPANMLQPAGTGSDITAGIGLSVTASNFDSQRASFAGYGSEISIAAAGSFRDAGGPPGIFGAFPGNLTDFERAPHPCGCRTFLSDDNRYGYLEGTSMAVPQVAATAAMMRALNRDLTAQRTIQMIKQTASRAAGAGWSPELGWGILNAGAAISAASTADLRAPVTRARAPARTHKSSVLLRWTGADRTAPGIRAAGVARVTFYARRDGGRARAIGTTRTHRLRYRLRAAGRYAFWSLAVDKAGNRETKPLKIVNLRALGS